MEFYSSGNLNAQQWLKNLNEFVTIPTLEQFCLRVWTRGEKITKRQVKVKKCPFSDRLQPSKFMQARIGDLFVVRNSANMVPLARNFGNFREIASNNISYKNRRNCIRSFCYNWTCCSRIGNKVVFKFSKCPKFISSIFLFRRGNVCQVLVCGHSDCKAINTLYQLYNGRAFDPESPMDHWLRHNGHLSIQKLDKLVKSGESCKKLEFASENGLMRWIKNIFYEILKIHEISYLKRNFRNFKRFTAQIDPENNYGVEDKLSQINALQQLTNIASHEFLREHIEKRLVGLQAFWLDIFTGEL